MLSNCGAGEDLKIPWTARRSNQSPEYSLEGVMLKLKLQYLATLCEDLTHWKRPWCWERLMTGGEGDDREWDGWMASPTRWTWVSARSGSWWWTGRPGMLQSMGLQRTRHNWVTELNWTETKYQFPDPTCLFLARTTHDTWYKAQLGQPSPHLMFQY